MNNIPDSFNFEIYKQYNIDLSKLSNNELTIHYEHYGKLEGRICSKIMNRNDFIHLIPQDLDILEIGPLCSPVMDVSRKNVKTLDYFSQEELKENYKTDKNVNVDKISKVTYVMKSNKYLDIVQDKFDICFSSHNIEHVPCIITFLNNISDILKPNGYFFLCIPDYRYCFDHYRNESNIFEILQAYLNQKKIPNIVNVLESNFLTTHNDSKEHWNQQYSSLGNIYIEAKKKLDFYTEKSKEILNSFDIILELIKNVQREKYIDSHCWKFTPFSLQNILYILYVKKYISLKIHRIYPTLKNSCEFYVILQKC